MRAQSLPVFFLINLVVVLVPALILGSAVSVFVFHDHVVMAAIRNEVCSVLVFSTVMTLGERSRRRRVGTPQ
jgi:hypothetical protein